MFSFYTSLVSDTITCSKSLIRFNSTSLNFNSFPPGPFHLMMPKKIGFILSLHLFGCIYRICLVIVVTQRPNSSVKVMLYIRTCGRFWNAIDITPLYILDRLFLVRTDRKIIEQGYLYLYIFLLDPVDFTAAF